MVIFGEGFKNFQFKILAQYLEKRMTNSKDEYMKDSSGRRDGLLSSQPQESILYNNAVALHLPEFVMPTLLHYDKHVWLSLETHHQMRVVGRVWVQEGRQVIAMHE